MILENLNSLTPLKYPQGIFRNCQQNQLWIELVRLDRKCLAFGLFIKILRKIFVIHPFYVLVIKKKMSS